MDAAGGRGRVDPMTEVMAEQVGSASDFVLLLGLRPASGCALPHAVRRPLRQANCYSGTCSATSRARPIFPCILSFLIEGTVEDGPGAAG